MSQHIPRLGLSLAVGRAATTTACAGAAALSELLGSTVQHGGKVPLQNKLYLLSDAVSC